MSSQPIGSPTRLSAHLAVCGGAWVRLHTYPDRSPILTVSTGEVSVTVAMARADLDGTAMTFVRELADAVARFAEDCARFAAPTDDQAGNARPKNMTGGPVSSARPGPGSTSRSRVSRAA